jgi:receptor-type tyrosine-protein phosphatase gamma
MITSFIPQEYLLLSANKPFNRNKNRSQEFIPVENSRVHLTPKPGVEGSDYINASWIIGKYLNFIVKLNLKYLYTMMLVMFFISNSRVI